MCVESTYVWCRDRGYKKPILACVACERFWRCGSLTEETREKIIKSDRTEWDFATAVLIPRRVKMYLFKMKDGTFQEPYKGFNIDNPDFSQMPEVEEVLFIGKVFVPQMKLVVKKPAAPAADTEKPRKRRSQKTEG